MLQANPGVGQKSKISTLIKLQADKALRDEQIQPGSTVMAEKKEPGSFGQPINPVITNMYRLDALSKIVIYRYEVDIVGIGQNRDVPLTENAASDYRKTERRYICHCIFNAFKQRIGASNANGQPFYYDQQRILFTLKPLDVQGEHTFPSAEILLEGTQHNFPQYRLKIAPVTDGFQLTLADFSHLTNDASRIDRSMEHFLDIATTQEVFNDPNKFTNFSASLYYMLNPSEFGFTQAECPFFASNSSFLGIGTMKGVRPIQAPDSAITSGMVVQVKKTPFHVDAGESVSTKVNLIVGSTIFDQMITEQIKRQCEHLIKGIWVETTYGTPRKFEIYAVSNSNSRTEMIQNNGSEMTVLEYYKQRYDIHLRYPNLPLLVRKEVARLSHFPMELCAVLDNQRVKVLQQTPAAGQEMIRCTALPPAKLIPHNVRAKNSLQLANSTYLAAARLRFHDQPIEVKARQLPPPQIQFGANAVEKPRQPASTWQGRPTYLVPARIEKWKAIAISGRGRDSITHAEWSKFVGQFSQCMTRMGMQATAPVIEVIPSEGLKMDGIIRNLGHDGFDYALFGHPDAADDVHHAMKFYEQATEVITQGVKISTVKKVVGQGQPMTLANIVHKTNVKMGGLNYAMIPAAPAQQLPQLPSLFGQDTLIIGFAMNHPGGGLTVKEKEEAIAPPRGHHTPPEGNGNGSDGGNGSEGGNGGNGGTYSAKRDLTAPSVVGFAANIGKKNAFEFIGDYVYQAPLRDEKVTIISNIIKRCVQQFQVVNNRSPQRIIVFRNGCAEGAFQNILKYEVPLMKKGMTEAGCQAKITLLVVNKLQPVRCYPKSPNPQAKATEQNIQPGTVIDTGIVHPKWTDFFLNSHRAIQGTAAIPHYHLLVDENALSMDTLQMMTHNLCFGHQIVYSPTSLPSPVYIADEYAKRGRNNYNFWVNSSTEEVVFQTGIDKYEQLTNLLNMEGSQYLKFMRVNA